MKRTILFRIHKGEKYYIAEGVDVPVVTQAKTLDKLIENLKEAIELHFEDKDFTSYDIIPEPTIIANMEIGPINYATT